MSTHQEYQYLRLIKTILDNGTRCEDQTGTHSLSVFGRSMRFSLDGNRLPLLTTRKVFFRRVCKELLCFLSGSTNSEVLSAKSESRDFLEGDSQWRQSDQISVLIHQIKTNPTSRRLILSSWVPCDITKMTLPPCHCLAQFYVASGKLSCQLYQRSEDMSLGVPFNIASYALLTILIAHVTGLEAHELIYTLGDAYVYLNHAEALTEQLTRTPRTFPKVYIDPSVTDIFKVTFDHITIVGYQPYANLLMKMAM